MARRVIQIVKIIDDMTGDELPEEEGRTVRFGLGSRQYEIDLADKRADELEGLLAPYVARARLVSRGRGPDKNRRRTRKEMQEIEEWAKANGYGDLRAPSGKIRKSVLEAYDNGEGS